MSDEPGNNQIDPMVIEKLRGVDRADSKKFFTIKPGLNVGLMFNEHGQTRPDSKFGWALTDMFEMTGQQDDYYHYCVAKEGYDWQRFLTEVYPLLDGICIPARKLTWEEFEHYFDRFVGGSCWCREDGKPDIYLEITELDLMNIKGAPRSLDVSLDKDDGLSFLILPVINPEAFTLFDHHDGTVSMVNATTNVVFKVHDPGLEAFLDQAFTKVDADWAKIEAAEGRISFPRPSRRAEGGPCG